ncbi:MAG: hypothetical protein LBE75_08580 [Burkholderiales bacterium]|nr:hypothetical protein [Burkholderiales bacterium]
MKSFFDQLYGCCGMALAVLFATGCTVLSAPVEHKEASPPVAEASAPAPAAGGSVNGAVTPKTEEVLLRKQAEEYADFQKLLGDLALYPSVSPEEAQRLQVDLNNKISATGQNGENENRVRLASLLSLNPAGANDQRAISLLEAVAKNEKASTPLQHLATVLRAKIQEKQRALQKLEALIDLDRRLLEERMPDGKKRTPPAPPKAAPKRPSGGRQ